MKRSGGLTLPLAVLALVAVGLVMTGAIRWTLGPPADASVGQIGPANGDAWACADWSAAACGDPGSDVHLERDATIRSRKPGGPRGSITGAP